MCIRSSQGVSRRGFVAAVGMATTGAWLLPRTASGSPFAGALWDDGVFDNGGLVGKMRREAAGVKLDVLKVCDGYTVLHGAGGNIGVLTTGEGKLLVDAGLAGARPQITEALGTIGGGPVKYLVNTHWHFDHTDGNEWLHGAGATIVAHENCRKRLAASTRVDDWGFTFAPSPGAALPVIEVGEGGLGMRVGGGGGAAVLVRLRSIGPAHTDGDLIVELPELDVIQMGDTWWNGHYPFIDYSTGGNIDGTLRAVESTLAKAGPKTIIIPGHGLAGTTTALTEYRDALAKIREKVRALKKQGRSMAEAVEAKPTAEFDGKWGTFVINGDFFTRLVYKGV